MTIAGDMHFVFLRSVRQLTIKIAKFKPYLIPAKYIPIWTAIIIDSSDLEVLVGKYRKNDLYQSIGSFAYTNR